MSDKAACRRDAKGGSKAGWSVRLQYVRCIGVPVRLVPFEWPF